MEHQEFKKVRILTAGMIGLALVLGCTTSAKGEVTVGDQLYLDAYGFLSASYSGVSGDHIGSPHNLGLGINGTLNGYYFHPNFLRFAVHPYYDRAQSNSDLQRVSRGSGVQGTLQLFGGSRFPGSISYGKDFNSSSEFRIAGVPSVLGDSSGSTFNVNWSALLTGLPSLYASYTMSDSSSSLLGTTSRSESSFKSLNLNSSYELGGFTVNGGLNHYNSEFLSPGFLTGGEISGASSSMNYGITAARTLPFAGSLALRWLRTTSENKAGGRSVSSSYGASAIFSPVPRLSVSGDVNYTTNAIASMTQELGGDASSSYFLEWNAVNMHTQGTLTVGRGFAVSGYLSHRIQRSHEFQTQDTQYGGSASFSNSNRFLGFLTFSIGVLNTATQEGNTGVGLVSSLSMMRKFGRWETSADFSYSQYTRTLLSVATTSNYSFGGILRRKINESTFWSGSFRETMSGLTLQKGNNNVSQSLATGLYWKGYGVVTNYSRSNGAAVLSADGTLTATPLGSIISNNFMTFDARSFGVYTSARFFRILFTNAGYSNVSSSTVRRALGAFNKGNRFYGRLEVRLRQLRFTGGFTRAEQESSALPGGPRAVNSYYVTLSRWFNIL